MTQTYGHDPSYALDSTNPLAPIAGVVYRAPLPSLRVALTPSSGAPVGSCARPEIGPSTVSLVRTQPAARISITAGRDWKDEFENMRSPNQPPALCLAKLPHAERAILAPSVMFRD